MKTKLFGIPETMLIPLWARSVENKQKNLTGEHKELQERAQWA